MFGGEDMNVDRLNQNDDDDDASKFFGRKRKKFKNSDKGSLEFLIKMFFIACFIEVYFIINFVLGRNDLVQMRALLKEFNYTTIAESYYSLTMNS